MLLIGFATLCRTFALRSPARGDVRDGHRAPHGVRCKSHVGKSRRVCGKPQGLYHCAVGNAFLDNVECTVSGQLDDKKCTEWTEPNGQVASPAAASPPASVASPASPTGAADGASQSADEVGFGRIAALYHRLSTSYQIH